MENWHPQFYNSNANRLDYVAKESQKVPLDKDFTTPEDESSYEEPKPTKRAKKEEVQQEEKEAAVLDLGEDLANLEKEAAE